MVILMESQFSAAVVVFGTLMILSIAFALPWYVWPLGFLATGVIAQADLHIGSSFGEAGEAVFNRILLTGVVLAILFVVNELRGPFSWLVWLAALALWLSIAVATAYLKIKKGEVSYPSRGSF